MPKVRRNVSTTCSPSSLRISPVSTNTHVSWGPMALCTRAAATAESTPPDSPQIARPVADLRPDRLDLLLDDRRHRPRRPAAAGVVEEPLQQLLAVRACARPRGGTARRRSPGRRDSNAAAGVGRRRRQHREALGRPGDRVEVAHPHDLLAGQVGAEQRAAGVGDGEVGAAVLAPAGLGDLAAEVAGDELAAVADAEHRDAGLVDGRVDRRRALGVHRRRAAARRSRPSGCLAASSAAVIVCGTISL